MTEKLDLLRIRKHLHQIAEVSEKEVNTADYVFDIISKLGLTKIHRTIGGNGVLAEFDTLKEGPTCLFRAELDALPIQEINTFDYKSSTDGVSHKCGHDGHMTILIGLINQVVNNPTNYRGKILFLFQPAEENGVGAVSVLKDLYQLDLQIDYAFALHNVPGYTEHQIFCKEKEITPAVVSVVIKLNGKTAHAAEPENGINPALPISELINSFNDLNQPDKNRKDFTIFTPIHINMGEIAYGISAGHGEVHYTIRCWTNEQLDFVKKRISEISTHIISKYHIDLSSHYIEEFKSNQNDATCVNIIKEACHKTKLIYNELHSPFKWGEDFGVFTEQFKGALFGIGAGQNIPALHNPDYDFPDDLIESGILIFNEILIQSQKQK